MWSPGSGRGSPGGGGNGEKRRREEELLRQWDIRDEERRKARE
jgi:hypothetical protein